MLVVGVWLCAFGGWGMTRPDLFEGRALPILASIAGGLFAAVAIALRSASRGIDALELDGGRLTFVEGDGRTTVGLAGIAEVHVVEEPLGRGHPLLCVSTASGSVIEVAMVRSDHIELFAAALREDLAAGVDEVPPLPRDAPIAVSDGAIVMGDRRIPLAEVTAVDVVHQASVLGMGLVVHRAPVELLDPTARVEAAVLMRRIAAGEHVSLARELGWGTAVLLALHVERARKAV